MPYIPDYDRDVPMARLNDTQRAYVDELERAIIETYDWPREDPVRLERHMTVAAATIAKMEDIWRPNSHAATAAWKAIGKRGVPTISKLRSL